MLRRGNIIYNGKLINYINKYSYNNKLYIYNKNAITSNTYNIKYYIQHKFILHYFTTIHPKGKEELNKQSIIIKKKSISFDKKKNFHLLEHEQKLESALEKGGERVLRVKNLKNLDEQIPKYSNRMINGIKKLPNLIIIGNQKLFKALQILVKEPTKAQEWIISLKKTIIHELKHYWLGSKLMYADVTTSTRILRRVLRGNALSRRERKQLQRTVADLLRLVPFSFFIIIPFMELLLPFALKMFPNMLPSTFRDSYQREEDMKRQLRLRVALAEFLQETVKDVMKDTRDADNVTEEKKSTAEEVLDFVERAQRGEPLSSDETLKVAKLFNDELMLDNISRPQLVGMCRYMGLQPYGNDNFLRFQLRNKVRQLKKDDQDIIWEGLESLTKEELQQACMERGMRATGLTKAGYNRQMRQWLDLSINKNVPASLLIMSRALNITAIDKPEIALATSLSSMDDEVITEVALEAGSSPGIKESVELRARKLESIRYQNEMIADEEKDRKEEAKKQQQEENKIVETKEKEKENENKNVPVSTTMTVNITTQINENDEKKPVIEISSKEQFPIETVLVDKAKVYSDTALPSASTSSDINTSQPIEKEKEVEKRELTLDEVSALESLAFKSLVEKERIAIDLMKQMKSEMDVEALSAAGRIGVSKKKENKSADRMMKKLDSMISNLEIELDKVDQSVGDKLNFLDKDSDGVLSTEELKAAVKSILRKHNTEEDAEWVVQQIDENCDGKVTLEELMEFIKKRNDMWEITGAAIPTIESTPTQSTDNNLNNNNNNNNNNNTNNGTTVSTHV